MAVVHRRADPIATRDRLHYKRMLYSYLTNEQITALEDHGAFMLEAASGWRYRFDAVGNVYSISPFGLESLCCISARVGYTSMYAKLLAKYLLIVADEPTFLRVHSDSRQSG